MASGDGKSAIVEYRARSVVALDNVHQKGNIHNWFNEDDFEGYFVLVASARVSNSNNLSREPKQ